MFFVSLLLNQIVAWMRGQTGTTSLRAMLYMDEIVGYFPPVANPPSKAPLLTLLKQARAFGIGVVLATQNPVDLDYKGLANTGTWFLGRLQTERDKARVLDGLEGAAAGSMDRAETDRLLSALDKRVFLLHNVHDDGAGGVPDALDAVVSARTAVPRSDSSADSGVACQAAAAGRERRSSGRRKPSQPVRATVQAGRGADSAPPVLPPGIQQFFVSLRRAPARPAVHYTPVVIGAARVGFRRLEARHRRSARRALRRAVQPGAIALDWAGATRLEAPRRPLSGIRGAGCDVRARCRPPGLQAKNYAAWSKDFAKWLAQSEKLELLRQRDLKLTSGPRTRPSATSRFASRKRSA